jgi:hypothetical protein
MPIFKRTMLQLLVGALLFSTPELAAGPKADGVQPPRSAATGGVASIMGEAPRILGNFSLASFDGMVILDSGNDLEVEVGVNADVVNENQVTPGKREIPSEKIQVWVLLEQGKVAAPHEKSVEYGWHMSCRVDCTSTVTFTFEKPEASPVAIVLKLDDQFQTFQIYSPSK